MEYIFFSIIYLLLKFVELGSGLLVLLSQDLAYPFSLFRFCMDFLVKNIPANLLRLNGDAKSWLRSTSMRFRVDVEFIIGPVI